MNVRKRKKRRNLTMNLEQKKLASLGISKLCFPRPLSRRTRLFYSTMRRGLKAPCERTHRLAICCSRRYWVAQAAKGSENQKQLRVQTMPINSNFVKRDTYI